MAELLGKLRQVEARKQVQALLDRDPATTVTLDNPHGVAMLLRAGPLGPSKSVPGNRTPGIASRE
ncbi:hypothetical protein [Nocardia sp. NPDC059691]|uniref:hypothetical protein n=1 Tax=Nocardia sp. NPDC059691 TaxID=3346908 RepID=UPI00367F83DF